MASLTDGAIEWHELEEELTCYSCGNLFLEPKTLSCLHTFCTKCIHDSIPVQPNKLFVFFQPQPEFNCFICKASYTEKQLNSFPKNVSMECLCNIVKKRRAIVKPATNEGDEDASDLTVTCTQCEEGAPATKWCLMCEDAEICEECYRSHCRLKIYKSHKVIELKEFIQSPSLVLNCRPHCEDHNGQPLEFHCKVCHKFMCQRCTKSDLCKNGDDHSHDLEVIDDIREAKIEKIKDLNLKLQTTQQELAKKLQQVECTNEKLKEMVSKEVAWIKERFQEIRKHIDIYEELLLLNLETIQATGNSLLLKQSTDLSQDKKRLTCYKQFTSGVLFPCRVPEIVMYSDWICNKELKEVDDNNSDLAYKTEDIIISRGSFNLGDFHHELLSLHQIFHHPHFENCTVELLSEGLSLIEVKVTLKDKYGLLVPNQLSHLDVKSEKNKSFFSDLNWKNKEKGVYTLSYHPLVEEPHSLSVTWKDIVLDGDTMIYENLELNEKSYSMVFNKRTLVKPLFLASTAEDHNIIGDPGDSRLIVTGGSYFFYSQVITNYNYPNFHPTGIAVGFDNSCLYVANSGEDCIYSYKKSELGYSYRNHCSSRFGGTGTGDGKFQSPQGLAMSKHGLLFICDRNNHRIQVYNTTVNPESFCYAYSQAKGDFNHPTDVTLNEKEDKVFVTDTDNHKVKVFTLADPFSTMCFVYYIDFKQMQNPFGICCTNEGHILVTSTDCVLAFKQNGAIIGGRKFKDEKPAGIIASSKGEIIIAFTKSRKVRSYTYGHT